MLVVMLLAGGCVGKKKYEAVVDDLTQARSELATTTSARDALQADLDAATAELEAAREREASLTQELAAKKKSLALVEAQLLSERGEKAELLKKKGQLEGSIEEMTSALEELARRKAQADERVAAFRDLVARFKGLIDSGKLQVRIIDGRMVVQLATDVLFSSGSAALNDEGRKAVREVADVLKAIPDREFQVEGHTDNVPIRTERYPSNWELAADRALTVVNEMMEVGMPASRISAASYGENDPIAPNRTDAGKSQNRRIQIVIVPDLSDLPGYEELQGLTGGN